MPPFSPEINISIFLLYVLSTMYRRTYMCHKVQAYVLCNLESPNSFYGAQVVFQSLECCWQTGPPVRQWRPYQPRACLIFVVFTSSWLTPFSNGQISSKIPILATFQLDPPTGLFQLGHTPEYNVQQCNKKTQVYIYIYRPANKSLGFAFLLAALDSKSSSVSLNITIDLLILPSVSAFSEENKLWEP